MFLFPERAKLCRCSADASICGVTTSWSSSDEVIRALLTLSETNFPEEESVLIRLGRPLQHLQHENIQ